MTSIQNSELMKHVLKAILTTASRRSGETIAILFMNSTIEHLQTRYNFLKNLTIKSAVYKEHSIDEIFTIETSPEINLAKPRKIGEAIESIIRIICMDLREESGLFFIKEIKGNIRRSYLFELRGIGVDLDLIQLEHHFAHRQRLRERAHSAHDAKTQQKIEKRTGDMSILQYTWNKVSSWKYKDNKCYLYDQNGKELDNLDLDKVIENHIKKLNEFDNRLEKVDSPQAAKKTEIFVDEKQHEFLQMIYSRDTDFETVKWVMHITGEELEEIITNLVRKELLEYVKEDEIEITEKGIDYILAEKKKEVMKMKS